VTFDAERSSTGSGARPKTVGPGQHRLFVIVLVAATVGPFLYALVSSFFQLPPATIVIRHTVRSDGRYPVYATTLYTFMLIEIGLIALLAPALIVKKLAQKLNKGQLKRRQHR
jgi:hypothetical protein